MNHTVGILHPGNMGISVAASALKSGNTVYWLSEGRSRKTRERAEEHGLFDAQTLENLCRVCTVILSVCPPHAAEDVATQVAACGFNGFFVDANAISPERAARIHSTISRSGARFVDGGIIGRPAWEPGRTWLYLSGADADEVASLFAQGSLETQVLGEGTCQASALKMCCAAYTKGTTALLAAILATAETLEVREALNEQWTREDGFAEETAARVQRVTAKAWRYEGEMEEIAATFQAAGLPGGFHEAAADVYRRLARFKDEPMPPLKAVIAALRDESQPQ